MKTKFLLFIFTLVVTVSTLQATNFTVGGIVYYITSSSSPYTAGVTSGGNYTGAVNIPDHVTYNSITYEVTTIEQRAFKGCSSMTSVTIPNSTTSIGGWAFYGCSGLTSINIPSSVITIGSYGFLNCNALINVDSNNPNYSSLDGVLYNKSQTTLEQCPVSKTGSFIIPSTVTFIAVDAFYRCSGLTSVTIPNSVTSIGEEAFYLCSGLTSLTISTSVTSIGVNAFSGCSSLTSVELPNSLTSIEIATFQRCTALTSVTIPASVTSIGEMAFSGCSGLTSVTIPSSVISIGDAAFGYCNALISINVDSSNPNYSSLNRVLYNKNQTTLQQCPASKTGSFIIPSTVTSISAEAFGGCSGLTSLTIPNSVTSIGETAFVGCSGLTSIYSNSTTPIDISNSPQVFWGVDFTKCVLYVPIGSKNLYAAASQWSDFVNIIEEGTGISTVNATELNIIIKGRVLEIALSEGVSTVQIININGEQIYNGRATGNGTFSETLPNAGIYMVKIENKVAKVIVN